MKEMLGGCCVCSDERGWHENPLVYCDGTNCTVAVHQACYGIVKVPSGPWFCEKCAAPEKSSRIRCELCPMREGALKHTDDGRWAHVICALYIPEIRFGNVSTMDPIVISQIPSDRYNRPCYLCEKKGETVKSTSGACMECNKNGCTRNFHVTCAQQEGLLCEESSSAYDNIKYCGYCDSHFKKLRRDPNIKQIPPFKPPVNDKHHRKSVSPPDILPLSNDMKVSNESGGLNTALSNGPNCKPFEPLVKPVAASFAGSNGSLLHQPSKEKESKSAATTSVSSSTPTSSTESCQTSSLAMGKFLNHNNSERKTPSNSSANSDTLQTQQKVSSFITTGNHMSTGNSHSGANKGGSRGSNDSSDAAGRRKLSPISREMQKRSEVSGAPMSSAELGLTRNSMKDPRSSPATTSPLVRSANNNSSLYSPSLSVGGVQLQSTTGAGMASLYSHAGGMGFFNNLIAPTPVYSSASISATIAAVSQGAVGGRGLELIDSNNPAATTDPQSFLRTPSSTVSSGLNSAAQPLVNPFSAAAAGNRPPSNMAVGTKIVADLHSRHVGTNGGGGEVRPTPSEVGPVGNGEKKRRSDGSVGRPPKDSSTERPAKRPKKQQLAGVTKKTVKTLLEQVSPVVADTVSSFQKERVAAAAATQLLSVKTSSSAPSSASGSTPTTTTAVLFGSLGPSAASASLPGVTPVVADSLYLPNVCGPSRTVAKVSPASSNSGAESSQSLPFPTSLEQLLERQWEQGSQFLMDQAQHFDIASLLNCLHQLKSENQRLEEHVMTLSSRRDHLLAVNARLALPLGTAPTTQQRSPRVAPYIPEGSDTGSHSQHPPAPLSPTRTLSRSGLPGTSVVGGNGVFTTVKQKAADCQSNSPERSSQSGSFMVPRTPTPLLVAVDLARPQTPLAALSSHYNSINQEHHQQLLFNLMQQQQQAATLAAYGLPPGLFSQGPSSPHRTLNLPQHLLHSNSNTSSTASKS